MVPYTLELKKPIEIKVFFCECNQLFKFVHTLLSARAVNFQINLKIIREWMFEKLKNKKQKQNPLTSMQKYSQKDINGEIHLDTISLS